MVQINLTYKDSELLLEIIKNTIEEIREYNQGDKLYLIDTMATLTENFKGRLARTLDVWFYNEDN